jgi:hypothetical protein
LAWAIILKAALFKQQGDQKSSVHLTITVQSSGAQRLFDHPVQGPYVNEEEEVFDFNGVAK